MGKAQLNIKLINNLKDILFRIHRGESQEVIRDSFVQHLNKVSSDDILIIVHELKSRNETITSEDVRNLFHMYHQLYGQILDEWNDYKTRHPGHPVQVLKEENENFKTLLNEMNVLLKGFEKGDHSMDEEGMVVQLKNEMRRLGQFYRHYNRKEKLIFPILERYGHYMITRHMWADDDRVRTLYKGVKGMVEQLPHLEFQYLKKVYDHFESQCREMIFDEEAFLLPIAVATLHEEDWSAVAEESPAYGFAFEAKKKWIPSRKSNAEDATANREKIDGENVDRVSIHHKFGAGYLTLHEVDQILNHLPLELTFVDKNGIFKYFNDRIKSADMMFIRTPIAVGRHVANCHPPKSMSKVMKLIRELKTKKRSSESMWFKKKGEYVHVTYKAVFDEDGEYVGILEYVQDIQPFFDLPREVKKEVSGLEE